MAEFLLPKQIMRVRFPLPAPNRMNRFNTNKVLSLLFYSINSYTSKNNTLTKNKKNDILLVENKEDFILWENIILITKDTNIVENIRYQG